MTGFSTFPTRIFCLLYTPHLMRDRNWANSVFDFNFDFNFDSRARTSRPCKQFSICQFLSVCSVSRARTLSHLAKSPCLPPPCIDLVFILRHSFADSPPLQRRPLRALSPKPHLAAPPGRTTHTDTNIQRQWGAERELSKGYPSRKITKKVRGPAFHERFTNFFQLAA